MAFVAPPADPGRLVETVLERDGFALLKGKKVGLVTNQTGINRQRHK